MLSRRLHSEKSAFVWGAGAKGVTFSNLLSRKSIRLDAIVDVNPAKQGRYCAGVGLPIIPPSSARARIGGTDVYVMNPVYLSEIRENCAADVNLIPVTQ
jgi:hypothetical protein